MVEATLVPPTATHSQLVRHDTPAGAVCTVPAGRLGTVAMDQVAPFQTCASGPKPMLGSLFWPTALQVVGLKQSTPTSRSDWVGDTSAVVACAQVEPFHCAANVRPGLTPSEKLPTAWQNEAPTHDTPARVLVAPL